MSKKMYLQGLERLTWEGAKEHEMWLQQHLPTSLKPFFDAKRPVSYSLLDHPKLWSGARSGETKIGEPQELWSSQYQPSKPAVPCATIMQAVIDRGKQKYRNDPKILKQITTFEKQYAQFFSSFRERSLFQAVKTSIELARESGTIDQGDLDRLDGFFNSSLLYNLKTRWDCIVAHGMIHAIYKTARDKASSKEDRAKLKQVTVLAKRYLDLQNAQAKKTFPIERGLNGLSALFSFIGLATGIPAFVLGVISLAVPPLAPILMPACFLLGSISMVSYGATAISGARMLYEGKRFHYSPSAKELRTFVVDIILAPWNFVGTSIFASIGQAAHHGKAVIAAIGNIWNNMVSNVFPDSFDLDEVASDAKDLVSDTLSYRRTQLHQHTSASTFKNVMSTLLTRGDTTKVNEVIRNTKEQVKYQPRKQEKTLQKAAQNLTQAMIDIKKVKLQGAKPLQDAINGYLTANAAYKNLLPGQDEKIYSQNLTQRLNACSLIAKTCLNYLQKNPSPLSSAQRILVEKIRDNAYALEKTLLAMPGRTAQLSTDVHGVNCSYVQVPTTLNPKVEQLVTHKSYHARILTWDDGFVGTGTSTKADKIIQAVEDYKNLAADANPKDRLACLELIQVKCIEYTSDPQCRQSRRLPYVEQLTQYVTDEINTIKSLQTQPDEVVLVSYSI